MAAASTLQLIRGSIASVAWIAFYPWAKLKRLQQLEADAAAGPEQSE
ncbi:hypothetical protein [Microbacterium sp.]